MGPIVAAVGAIATAVVSTVGAVASFVSGLGALGQLGISLGLSIASGYIREAVDGKNKKQPAGVQFERQYGGAVPRQVGMGIYATAGHDTYTNTYGPSNYELQQVYVLSDFPCHALARVIINGEYASIEATESSLTRGRQVTSGPYAGLIWFKFLDGTQTEAFLPLVNFANPGSRWTEDHIGAGCAMVIVSMTYNEERLASFPDFLFEVHGARLYNWRKDDTVGGVGSHRWGNYSTYEFTENPIVMEYNYRRGLSWNGDLFCGMGMPSSDLPLDKWTPAANICDEGTTYGPRYRCSIMLDCSATHGENIEALQLSCAALNIDAVDGSWPIVGHAQVPVITVTDADLVTGADVSWRGKQSMGDLVNSVSGNFPNPEDVWSVVGYKRQTNSTLVALDRRGRDININYPCVRVHDQAASLAAIALMENRYEASATITLPPRFQVLEAGDWIRWNSELYGDLTYVISGLSLASQSDDEPFNVTLTLRQRDGAIYNGVSVPPITIPTKPGAPVYLNEVQDFTVIPITIEGDDGRLYPAIRAAWSAITDLTVTNVDIYYYPVTQPGNVFYKRVPVTQTVVYLTEGIVARTEYIVKTKLVTSPARVTVLTAGETVLTNDVPDPEIDVYLQQIKGDAYAVLNTLRDDLNTAIANLDALARDSGLGFGSQKKQNSAVVRTTNALAAVSQELSAAVEVIDGEVEATAALVTAMQASVDDLSGSGLWKMEVRAGGGSVLARLAILMRASTASAWVEVGTVWEAYISGGVTYGRITNFADRWTVVNPNNNAQLPVFAVDNTLNQVVISNALIKNLNASNITVNALSALTANVGTLTAGILQGPKLVISLTAGTIRGTS